MYYDYNTWQPFNAYYMDADALVRTIGCLQKDNYKLHEEKRLAEERLTFYENGKIETSEAVREIPEQCVLTVLHRRHEKYLCFWYIEKCSIINFEISMKEKVLFLLLNVKKSNGNTDLVLLSEKDLQKNRAMDVLENTGCQIMQIGSKSLRG